MTKRPSSSGRGSEGPGGSAGAAVGAPTAGVASCGLLTVSSIVLGFLAAIELSGQ